MCGDRLRRTRCRRVTGAWLPYRLRRVAQLAVGLLDHLGVAQADIFGVSWVAPRPRYLPSATPSAAGTPTLAATLAASSMVPGRPGVLLQLLSPRRYLDPTHLLRIGEQLYGGILRFERDLLKVHAREVRVPSQRGYLYQLLAILGWTSWHRLPSSAGTDARC